VAVGIFFGFTPLFGFKTLLAMLLAWTFRCSYVAAAIAVNLHDVVFLLWPLILRLEFGIGYYLLHDPHVWPPRIHTRHLDYHNLIQWSWFSRVGWPMLLGSVFIAGPIAIVSFFVTLPIVRRYQAHRDAVRKAKLTARLSDADGGK